MDIFDDVEDYKFPYADYLRLPHLPFLGKVKERFKIKADATNAEVLRQLCLHYFKEFKKENTLENPKAYTDQIKRELETYDKLHFTDYIILIWAIIDYARQHGVFIDYGRGSCAGSLIFYVLGVTGVDPIKNGLFFERFVSEARSKSIVDEKGQVWLQADLVPDADLNLGEGRESVLKWLKQQYPERLCKILTVTTLQGKKLVQDVCKIVGGFKQEDAQYISDMVPRKYGVVQDIEVTYQSNPLFKEWADKNPKCYSIALRLRDLIRNYGVHASGYLLSETPLADIMPLQRDSKGELVSGYTMKFVPAIKVDLLGLTTNTIIRNVLDKTGEDPKKINLDTDPFIYDRFQDGSLLPYGLYQLSGDCMFRVANNVKPKDISELSDVSAIARPGALSYEDGYANFTSPEIEESFKPILKTTRNYCLYQEQMMQLLVVIGFTKDEAEICRRIVGKKEKTKVAEWEAKVRERAEKNGFSPEVADSLWKILNDSADYSFNKSHSWATSYTSALTVYLKYKYPQQFYLECLNDAIGSSEQIENIAMIKTEMDTMGIPLYPPDLINSDLHFKIEGKGIRYGLLAIKGIKEKTAKNIMNFRGSYSSKISCFKAASNFDINLGALAALIQAGTLSGFSGSRSRLILEAQTWNLLKEKEQDLIEELYGQKTTDILLILKELAENLNENGVPFIKDSRFKTIKKDYVKYKEIYLMNSRNEKLANYFYERRMIGYSYTETLKGVFASHNERVVSFKEALEAEEGERVTFVTNVSEVFVGKAKNGNRYMRMLAMDESGVGNILMFKQSLIGCEEFNGRLPEEDDVIMVQGKKKDNRTIFADKIGIQNAAIYFKFAEIEKKEKKKIDK